MKKIAAIFTLLIPLVGFSQQDPLYNQYLFNQAIINPAYTGIHDLFSATLISRNQWLGLEGGPRTNTLNAHTSLMKNRIGVGLTFLNDKLGVNSNDEVSMSYAYKVEFRRSVLAFGLQWGIITYKYDYSKLNFDFIDDPSFLPTQDSFSKTNFGAGLFFMGETYYLGLSSPRLKDIEVFDGVMNSTRYKKHIYLSGGYVFDQVFALKFKPSFLVRIVDGAPASIDLNGSILLNELLWVGITLRNLNSLGANAQLNLENRFRFGYSFELPSNKLITSGFGTHEFMVGIDMAIFSRQGGNYRYF